MAITVLMLGAVAVGQESSRRSDRSSDRSSRSDRSRSESSSSSTATTRPAGFIEGYRLVLDRNIFSKNRVIYREPGTTTTQNTTSYRQEPAMLLTGVTLEGHVATASIEDKRSGRTSLYHVGDALGDGRITGISIDSIEYTANGGQVSRVDLGRVIESGPTYSVASSGGGSTSGAPSPGAPPASSTPAPSAGSGDANDILERLRQKRLQETKQ